MAGVVMASSSDPIYTDLYHSQFQYSSGANSSWANMSATGLPLCGKARHCVAQLAAQKNATNVCYIDQMGRINSNGSVMGAAQLELADMLRCIANEQQVSELNNYHNTTKSDNCLISATMAHLPSITLECKSSGLNEIDSTGHGGHSSLMNPIIFDAEVSVNPGRQPRSREYDVTSAVIFAEMETLSVIDSDFKAHTSQSLSQADSSIECDHECCKMACANSSCGVSGCFASNSASSSDILQAYNDHQQLESTNLVVRCNPMLTASPPHDSLDDYSLSAINAGAALGCSNFSTRSMEASPLNESDASATAIDHLRHIRQDGISCNQNELVVSIDVPMMDDHGRNVCIQQEPHAVPHPLDGAPTADDMNECVLGATGITVPVCHEEPHYQISGSDMKVMQREAAYAAAAMQPVDWASILNASGGARPKRRNVRISQDPQTVSARRRRERISDRIRVLQRMVPGGMKLDTASMLDEAIHYLKYLKSRVQALEWLEREGSSSSTANSISSSSPPSAYNGMYCNFGHFSTSPTLLQVIK